MRTIRELDIERQGGNRDERCSLVETEPLSESPSRRVKRSDAASDKQRDRLIGVYIGVLAVFLAICSLGGGTAKEATLRNIEAANTWGFFQAKNLRRQLLRVQVNELELMPADPAASELRGRIDGKLKQYREQDKLLTSDPKTQEGLDMSCSIRERHSRPRAISPCAATPTSTTEERCCKSHIVLASVAIISGGTPVLVASAFAGTLGALLTLNGFTLLVELPFLA